MKTVTVNASKTYDIYIENGILDRCGEYIKAVIKGKKLCVITDDNVAPIYLDRVKKSLADSGFELCEYIIKNGERSKNADNFIAILNFLAENHLTRADALVALGGGVVGDLTGFAASAYLRGIGFIQLPTTLLAAVDSSVGGKTAIDLAAGKNLVGSFYQPDAVICDCNTFDTLPPSVFKDGCAEAVKYGIIGDIELFEHLKKNKTDFDREYVVERCVSMKRDIVNDDEFDKGTRQLLNLGHTVGHAIEACSEYKIPHGSAVAAGTVIIANACAKLGICTEQCRDEIAETLSSLDLPTSTDYTNEELFSVTLLDKKRSGDTINLVVINKIGESVLKKVSLDELKSIITAGTEV